MHTEIFRQVHKYVKFCMNEKNFMKIYSNIELSLELSRSDVINFFLIDEAVLH